MNAEERAKAVVDPCRLELAKDASASLEYRITLKITAVQREAMEGCAQVAIAYGRRVLAARVFSEQIAKEIRALTEELGKE